MSDAVKLNTDIPAGINKDVIELNSSISSGGKDSVEMGADASDVSKADSPQLDSLIGVVVNPKIV